MQMDYFFLLFWSTLLDEAVSVLGAEGRICHFVTHETLRSLVVGELLSELF